MKRRTLLTNATTTGLLALGATATAGAVTETDPEVSIRTESGDRVQMPLSEADVELDDCCSYPGECWKCDCRCCYC